MVKENLYTTDIEATKAANAVRKSFYRRDFPAATWVQITRLYMPAALVEVEVIAHLSQKSMLINEDFLTKCLSVSLLKNLPLHLVKK